VRARALAVLGIGLALVVGAALLINSLGDDDPEPAEVTLAAPEPVGAVAGLAADASGTVYLTRPDLDIVARLGPDGSTTPVPVAAGELDAPHGVAVAADGRLVVADSGHARVVLVDPASGAVTPRADVVPAANPYANAVTATAVADPGRQRILLLGDAGDAGADDTADEDDTEDDTADAGAGAGVLPAVPTSAEPGPLADGPDGALFLVDGTTVRRRPPDGEVLTVAGGGTEAVTRFDDVAATDLAIPDIRGLAVDPGGHVYASGTWGLAEVTPGGRLVRIETAQAVPVLGPLTAPALGVVVAAGDDGRLYRIQLGR
jgi:streptogramin lyase